MDIQFKLIIKRSDITKLDNLIKSGKVKVFVIKGDEYCLMQKVNNTDSEFNTSLYIWPRSWGYGGYNDGHCVFLTNVTNNIFLNYSEWLIDVINKLNKDSLANDCIIEIDETK